MSDLKNTQKRPVGRPRTDGRAHLTTAELLKATAKLMAKNGYSGTSFRMIAKELNVTIASIFHRYPSKEALLNAMIAHAAQSSMTFYDEIRSMSAPPTVKLFKSIVEEFRAVASVDRDYVAIFYLPELQRPEFKKAQDIRAKMVGHYASLIRQATKSGDLIPQDADWRAEQIFQLTETNIIAGTRTGPRKIEERALETARFCFRALLNDPKRLGEIETAARKIEARIQVDNFGVSG